eukprot:jgi/Psemu1/311728/fgenesh1_kg.820_\
MVVAKGCDLSRVELDDYARQHSLMRDKTLCKSTLHYTKQRCDAMRDDVNNTKAARWVLCCAVQCAFYNEYRMRTRWTANNRRMHRTTSIYLQYLPYLPYLSTANSDHSLFVYRYV